MNKRQFCQTLLAAPIAFGLYSPLYAQTSALAVGVEDTSKAFLRFYEDASKPDVTADQRAALWKQTYDVGLAQDPVAFANSWPRYAAVLGAVKGGFDGIKPSPVDMLGRIAGAARFTEPTKLTLFAYVGTFDKPAQLLQRNNELTLALPLELDPQLLASQAAHALAAYMVARVDSNPANAKTVAERLVLEGVALNHVRIALGAGGSDNQVLAGWPGYDASAAARLVDMARSVKPLLADAKPETIARLVESRELPLLGYQVVKTWQGRGLANAEILRTPRADFVRSVGVTLDGLSKR
jgi:hypothetical protein